MSLEEGTGTLLIQNPEKSDNGIYRCAAYNDLGTALSDKIDLLNETSIEFIREEPGEIAFKAELGKPFYFSCPKVVGYPQPELIWMKSRIKEEGIEMTPIEDDHITVDEKGGLWISHVKEDDDTFKNKFEYACLAASELHPQDISLAKSVSLQVVDPPEGRYNLEEEYINAEPFFMHTSSEELRFKSNERNRIHCIVGGE